MPELRYDSSERYTTMASVAHKGEVMKKAAEIYPPLLDPHMIEEREAEKGTVGEGASDKVVTLTFHAFSPAHSPHTLLATSSVPLLRLTMHLRPKQPTFNIVVH